MLRRQLPCWLLALSACAGSGAEEILPGAERRDILPLQAQPPSDALVSFVDPDTGFSTHNVHDVDREIVHFDGGQGAMIWGPDGTAVGGWRAEGNELRWNGAAGFQVRFGTEAGEQRAYFTESGPGTICNLAIRAPGQLLLSASNETPPQE